MDYSLVDEIKGLKENDEWHVDVLSAGGELLFTYIGLFKKNYNGPCSFLCVVMCQFDSGTQRVKFDNFHDLIYFFIDLVLPGGQWTSQYDERPASTWTILCTQSLT